MRMFKRRRSDAKFQPVQRTISGAKHVSHCWHGNRTCRVALGWVDHRWQYRDVDGNVVRNATTFTGSTAGSWRIDRLSAVVGDPLPAAAYLNISTRELNDAVESRWSIRGFRSNVRYAGKAEIDALTTIQEDLGRPHATCAALIPIRKSAAWWDLAQDERRAIMEEQSRHIGIGMEYLPAIARRLYHSRDLAEPFDFLTWFEFAPEDSDHFEHLVDRLRATEEWTYVEREVDIRLTRTV
jgi:Chlorite dismutase